MAYSLDNSKKSIQMTVSDEEFSCPLCFEILEEPKSLPGCAHNFCRSCLQQMVIRNNNNTNLSCPVCREPSLVPANGAEGFPTNTLLVRLMDNIPGRIEKRELFKAVASCKEEIEKNKKLYDHIDKQCSIIERNKELAQELKTQVSEYAKESIESIKKSEQKLCREIDEFLERKCGLSSQKKLDMRKKKLQTFLDQASSSVYNVEDILKKDDLTEILDMKTVMIEQLREYSNFSVGATATEINVFDLKIEKDKTAMENVLGKVVSRRLSGRGSACGRGQQDWGSSHSTIEIETENGESPHNSAESVPTVPWCHHDWEAMSNPPQHTPGSTQGEIITSVHLPFEPFRIAISPHSGDIAVLWKENNKVYLFNADGNHFGTINVRYGTLWDVGFSIDDYVVIVNRANNRLLFYTKDGQFLSREKEVPRTELKYAYLSVYNDGRLIVTSASTNDDDDNDDDDDDDDEVVQCIVVYDDDESSCKKMFGRKHLNHPLSRAVFHNGKYYIADEADHYNCSFIKMFSSQGQFLGSVEDRPLPPSIFISLSKDADLNWLMIGGGPPLPRSINTYDSSGMGIQRSDYNCPHNPDIHQQEILSKSFCSARFEGMLQVEIYRDQQIFNIVHYN